MIGGLGVPELVIIMIIALVIFGPSKLPDLGKSLGKGLRAFRDATKDITDMGGEIKGNINSTLSDTKESFTGPIDEIKKSVDLNEAEPVSKPAPLTGEGQAPEKKPAGDV